MPKYVNADELLKDLFKGKEKYDPPKSDADRQSLYAYTFAINLLTMAEPAEPETLEQETERAIKTLEAFKKNTQETHKEP